MKNVRDVQEDYVSSIIDGLDWKDMHCLLFDLFMDRLDNYTDAELEAEILENQPELLEETDV